MPNLKDAEKRDRQSKKLRAHNRAIKSTVRTSVKDFELAVSKNDGATAKTCFDKVVKLIDTAAGKGVYHKNTAARKKSRLHKVLASMK